MPRRLVLVIDDMPAPQITAPTLHALSDKLGGASFHIIVMLTKIRKEIEESLVNLRLSLNRMGIDHEIEPSPKLPDPKIMARVVGKKIRELGAEGILVLTDDKELAKRLKDETGLAVKNLLELAEDLGVKEEVPAIQQVEEKSVEEAEAYSAIESAVAKYREEREIRPAPPTPVEEKVVETSFKPETSRETRPRRKSIKEKIEELKKEGLVKW